MRLWGRLAVVSAVLLQAAVAECAWVVGADGSCVQRWVPRDVLRGPTAIVNATLLPVRNTIGGAEYAWNKTEWRWWLTALIGPAATGMSAAGGLFEAIWWVGTGTADMLTGGYFAIAPERATHISVQPEVSQVLTDMPPPEPEDRCGRARVAVK